MHSHKQVASENKIQLYYRVFTLIATIIFIFLIVSSFQSRSGELYEAFHNRETSFEEERLPELPVRLVIPTIGVDAEVQYVGLASNGTGEMDVPSNLTDVGWYQYGVRPGMRGSAVIAGHYNGTETPHAVFSDLHTLRVGDEVVIMSAEGIEDIFYVVKIETYDYDAPTEEVFLNYDGKARLNLITCSGEWLSNEDLYDKRTVVFTELATQMR